MHKIVKMSDKDTDLPAEIDLGIPLEQAWSVWVAMRATKGQHLPVAGALLDQPEALMNALFTLDSLMEKVTQQYMDSKHGRDEEPQHIT